MEVQSVTAAEWTHLPLDVVERILMLAAVDSTLEDRCDSSHKGSCVRAKGPLCSATCRRSFSAADIAADGRLARLCRCVQQGAGLSLDATAPHALAIYPCHSTHQMTYCTDQDRHPVHAYLADQDGHPVHVPLVDITTESCF